MKPDFGNILRMIMWLLMLVGGAVLSIYFDHQYFSGLFHNILFHIIMLIPGFLLLRMVLRASKNTGRYLARKGREGELPRMQTNKLVTDGIYGCMRHPMHLGLLFFPWSVALLVGSPFFILILAPVEMLFMLFMIKLVEETEAERKFGQAYREYKQQVPFFSFRKECLKMLFGKNI
jgi:protein-S-isoprenylcysteine O-methyltransferase Ste14